MGTRTFTQYNTPHAQVSVATGSLIRSSTLSQLQTVINSLSSYLNKYPTKCSCDNNCGCDYHNGCSSHCSCNSQCYCVSYNSGCAIDSGY